MKHALLLVNPVSGRKRAAAGLLSVCRTLTEGGILPTVYVTKEKGDAVRLAAGAADRYDLLLCCGGDGTLNETVNGLLSQPPERRLPLGYLPAGSTNDFAATLGLPTRLSEAAALVVRGKQTAVDVGRFNTRHFTYIASFGAFTAVSYETPQPVKNSLGHLAYLLGGAMALGNIHPYTVSYDCDGITGKGRFLFGAISNTTSLGGVYELPKEQVSLCDGQFELLLLRDNLYSPETIWNIVHRELTKDENIVFLHGKRIRLQSASEIPFTLDGEYGGKTKDADVLCLPGAVNLFVR